MDTYTIAEAARLVGTSRGKLYQAIRTGQLQAVPGGTPEQALRVTREALHTAGFPMPTPAAPDTPRETKLDLPPEPEPPGPAAEEAPAPAQPSDWGDRALIAHLERALEQARERELRLLDIVAHVTGQRSATPVSAAPEVPLPAGLPAAAPGPAPQPPLSGLRQQIVAVLREHPEGLSPQAVRRLLQVEKDVRSTMKGMVRSGLLTRLEAGRYVVAANR